MANETEKFVLRSSLTSPFGRKVRMTADVLGLNERITIMPADTSDENDTLRQQNPIGKVPCLVRADGSTVYDSGVIMEFLQEVAGTDRLLPTSGPGRIPMLVAAKLADGIIDAGALLIYEGRYHEPSAQSEYWLNYQRGKIMRSLAAFEASVPDAGKTDVVTIGLACALGFLDKRKLLEWRPSFPRLVAWLDAFAKNEPAFERTRAPSN